MKTISLIAAIAIPIALLYYYYTYYHVDVHSQGRQCTFLYLTGLQCPGCGGQRALHSLLHGQIIAALGYNVLFVVGLPMLIYLYYILVQMYILRNEKYRQKTALSTRFLWIFLIVLLLFFILRNIPVAPFTYLAPPQ